MEFAVLPSLENLLTQESFEYYWIQFEFFPLVCLFLPQPVIGQKRCEDEIAFGFWGGVNFYFQNDVSLEWNLGVFNAHGMLMIAYKVSS